MNSIRMESKWRYISSFEYYNKKSNLDILYIFALLLRPSYIF